MSLPTFDEFMRPLLELATKERIRRKTAAVAMADLYKLTPEEIAHKLPSGGSTLANRVGWAMTFLTKAGLIRKVEQRLYEATPAGIAFLASHQGPIRDADLKKIPGYTEAWAEGSANRQKQTGESDDDLPLMRDATATPHEVIAREVDALQTDFRGRLLQRILEQSPTFFEQLVLDVLVAMGYGGTREDAAERLGQSGDEGIDGRINQDALGLDQVMVQAKRYRPDRPVPRNEVQAFIGSLAGQGVTKGIFITTSSFGASAYEFVARGSATKVVLVDGTLLIDLMIRYGIGTRVAQTHRIHEIDQNYFEDEE